MEPRPLRLMIVRDTDSKEEVYGQIIEDEFPDDDSSVKSTDEVVRAYMAEFCSDCYIRNNLLDKGPLSNTFEGRVATVAEEAGMKEYNIVVKILNRPVDTQEIIEYHNKSFNEWEAALALHRGLPDPRVLDEPSHNDAQGEVSWNVFKQTFALVCLAMVASLVVGSFIDDKHT